MTVRCGSMQGGKLNLFEGFHRLKYVSRCFWSDVTLVMGRSSDLSRLQ